MTVSLKFVAVLICVVLTAVTATLILVVSLTFTDQAVEDIGMRYTRLTMTNLRTGVEGFLQGAVDQYYGTTAQALGRAWKLPNETWNASLAWTGNVSTMSSRTVAAWAVIDDWQQQNVGAMLSNNFTREFQSQICFADGTFLQTLAIGTYPLISMYYTSINQGTGTPAPYNLTAGAYRYFNFKTNLQTLSPIVGSRAASTDCRTKLFYTNTPTVPKGCYWESPYLSTLTSAVVGVYCALHNSSRQFLGVNGMTLSLDTFSKFVVTLERTENTEAFIVEDTGYLLTTTMKAKFQNSTTFRGTFNGTLKPNCMLGTSVNIILCRQSVETYPYLPLNDLNATVGIHPRATAISGNLQSGGENYWYGMTGVATYTGESNTTVVPGLEWVVVVIVPELDIISAIVEGRLWSIVAAASVFVVAAVLCFVLFSIFMSPLIALQQQMDLAAGMELDEPDPEPSALTEIANMQVAFTTMKTELKRVKQYLPQTLLAVNQQEDDDDDDQYPVADGQKRGTSQGTRTERSRVSSGGSRRSRQSAKSGIISTNTGSSGGAGRLNFDGGVARRKLTVLSFNMTGFHSASPTPTEFLPRQEAALTTFKQIVSEHKGVVDSFHGDRFIATFNACLNNPQHALRATKAVDELTKDHHPTLGKVTIGVATGTAYVGNMGINGLKRFCTVGAVYTQATVLERIAKMHATQGSALFTSSTTVEAGFEYYFQAVDVLRLPGTSRPTVLYVPEGRRSASANEWMYVLQSGTQSDAYVRLNEAFELYAKGDVQAARSESVKIPPAGNTLHGRARLDTLLAQDLDKTIAEMGRYYAFVAGVSKETTM